MATTHTHVRAAAMACPREREPPGLCPDLYLHAASTFHLPPASTFRLPPPSGRLACWLAGWLPCEAPARVSQGAEAKSAPSACFTAKATPSERRGRFARVPLDTTPRYLRELFSNVPTPIQQVARHYFRFPCSLSRRRTRSISPTCGAGVQGSTPAGIEKPRRAPVFSVGLRCRLAVCLGLVVIKRACSSVLFV